LNNVKFSIGSCATAHGRLQLHRFYDAANFTLRTLIVTVVLGLTGCATQVRAPPPTQTPPIQISESNRWQIDQDISAASLAATGVARNYARASMEKWRDRVHQRTETYFIPWFTAYWTQEWLTMRMAWYKLTAGEGDPSTKERLAAYLLQQYHDQVLRHVAQEIDLNVVREQSTNIYVHFLGEQLMESARHDGVPRGEFDQRLKDIAAISQAPPPVPSASLYQLVHANLIASLPAYTAMIKQIQRDAIATEARLLEAQIAPVANRSSKILMNKLAVSGGASAAAVAFGGVAGIIISLGVAGVEAATYQNEQPKMAALLRENLNAALDEMYFSFMEDSETGVMAGVYYLSGQIEQTLVKTVALPVELKPMPSAVPLSGQ
jgi:hypothetical protein